MPVKNKIIAVRITKEDCDKFHSKVEAYGTSSDILREFIEAFNDDRLTIQPDPKKEKPYVTRK